MGDVLSNLSLGFGVVFQLVQWTPAFLGGMSIPIPVNILLCLIGALVGTLVGVLPGIGTIATVAMLLPITFGLPPVGALIMLAGIYYGRSMAARPRRSWLTFPVRPARWSPRSMDSRWPNRAAPVRRWRSLRSDRSSPAASRPF